MPSPTFKQLEAIRTLPHDDFRPNSKQTKTTMAVSTLSNMEVPRVSRKNALLTVLALAAFVSVQHVFDPRPHRDSPAPKTYYSQEEARLNQIVASASDSESVKLEHCACARDNARAANQTHPESGAPIAYSDTTCSKDAYARGNGQKVVGFSFYGDISSDYSKKKGYFEGIEANLELMPKYYPGWQMRIYFDLDEKDPILKDLCDLSCKNPILDLCHAGKLPGTPMKDARRVFAMNWRFFPTLDPQVEFISE